MTDGSPPLDAHPASSAGPLAVLRGSVAVVARRPAVAGVFTLAAVSLHLSASFGVLAAIVAYSLAVVMGFEAVGAPSGPLVSPPMRYALALIAALLAAVAVGLGLVLAIVPGLYLAARLRLAPAAAFLDGAGPVDGLRRSYGLTEGRVRTVFGASAALGLLAVAVWLAVALVLAAEGFAVRLPDAATLERALGVALPLVVAVVGPPSVALDALLYGLYSPRTAVESVPGEADDAHAVPR